MLVSTDKKWDYALGMIKVDGLELSPEFKKLIENKWHSHTTYKGSHSYRYSPDFDKFLLIHATVLRTFPFSCI